MKNYLVDVPVLYIFFNNPQRTRISFERIREARPSKLFLYQDGARSDDDIEGIEECRAIVSDIDWKCEVKSWYQESNYGCDPSNYLSQKWAFSHTNKCIILEDDDLPSISFFNFCKEMLDKYEFDERISLISGMNHEENTLYCPYDYFFTTNISIWGWASWKRVIDRWDASYSFLKNKYSFNVLKNNLLDRKCRKDLWPLILKHSKTGIQYYETIMAADMILNHTLAIVPTKNLITNFGYSNGVHSNHSFEFLSKNLKKLYTLKHFELDFPLNNNPYIIEDTQYKIRVYKMMGWNIDKNRLCYKTINLIKKPFKKLKRIFIAVRASK